MKRPKSKSLVPEMVAVFLFHTARFKILLLLMVVSEILTFQSVLRCPTCPQLPSHQWWFRARRGRTSHQSQLYGAASQPEILRGTGLSHSFDGKIFQFKNVEITIHAGDRIALVGDNGVGKSTLLKLLSKVDNDLIETSRNLRISYVEQDPPTWSYTSLATSSSYMPVSVGDALFYNDVGAKQMKEMATCRNYRRALHNSEQPPSSDAEAEAEAEARLEELTRCTEQMEAGSPATWDLLQTAEKVAEELNLSRIINTPLDQISGGERKRTALAAGLISSPDLLLLDEPTNHLDLDGIQFIKNALTASSTRNSNMAVLVVTHDRAFLDSVCETVLELDASSLYRYSPRKRDEGFSKDGGEFARGSFQFYLAEKEKRLESEAKDMAATKAKMKKELTWINRQPQARETKQRARINSFIDLTSDLQAKKRMEEIRKGKLDLGGSGSSARLGNEILKLNNVFIKGEGGRELLHDFSFTFDKKDRIAV